MFPKLRTALLAAALAFPATTAFAEPISLEEAIAKAIEAAPSIRANEAAIEAARAGRVQADVRPNPVLGVESENFIGTGPYDVLSQAELTVIYAQTIERGGKREARIALAERDIAVAEALAGTSRLDIAAQVQQAYIDVQITEAVVKIAAFRLETEQQIQIEALRRVRGYKDPLFVETRAVARVATAQLALQEARQRLLAAKSKLASYWAGAGDDIEVAAGFSETADLGLRVAKSDEAAGTALVDRARAAVLVEQSRATQDYTVSGGLRFLPGTNDVAAVAGFTMPLGRFDRNKGNIERALAERRQAELLAEASRLERLRRLASLRADSEAALARADGLMRDVYPATVKTLEQVRWGYNRGGFNFRDVQDAADAIVQLQEQWLDAMTRYRDLQTEIDRLTGRFDAEADKGTNP